MAGNDPLIPALGAAAAVQLATPVATLAGNDAAVALPLPSGAPPLATVTAELSTTGQLLAKLLDALPASAAGIAQPRPLLPQPDAHPAAMAAAIGDGIARSGLFYESHLADWVEGKRTLEQIRSEPQAQAMDASDATTTPVLLREQIDMLDGQPLQWRGELWPGLPLQISIAKDSPPPSQGNATEPAWQTTLNSTLPTLGDVTARLRLEGDRLQLRLAASNASSGTRMEAEISSLRAALSAAGLQPLSIVIDEQRTD